MAVSDVKLDRFRRKILARELAGSYLVGIGKLYLEQRDDDAEALKSLSQVAASENEALLVERCCQRLIELGLQDEVIYVRYLDALLRLAKIEQCRHLCARALDVVESDHGLAELHRVATSADVHEVSLQATQRLLERDRDDPVRWSSYATALQHCGDLAAAESAYRKSLALNADSPLTRFLLSACRDYTPDDNNIRELETAIEREAPDTTGWHHLAYALAKELEDTERYDEAFEWYSAGATSVRKGINYSIESDRRLCKQFLNLYGLPGSDGVRADREPIFILGMPRTGSTLVERIISSHTQVVSQGETRGLLSSFALSLGVGHANTALFRRLDDGVASLDYGEIGQRYLDFVEPRSTECRHFIDKLPQNVFLPGLILRSFTNARIVYTDRNPMDACFSNYKQLFKPGSFPYSYDLKETAEHYDLIQEFAEHWCKHDPQRVTVVRYENLVSDPLEEIPKLLGFLDLDVQEACFSPEKNTAGLATASFSQARRPIYGSSSQKWRKFEKHLGVLKAHFGIS